MASSGCLPPTKGVLLVICSENWIMFNSINRSLLKNMHPAPTAATPQYHTMVDMSCVRRASCTSQYEIPRGHFAPQKRPPFNDLDAFDIKNVSKYCISELYQSRESGLGIMELEQNKPDPKIFPRCGLYSQGALRVPMMRCEQGWAKLKSGLDLN